MAAGRSGTSTCSCVDVALTTRPSWLPSKRTWLLAGVDEKFLPASVTISPARAREGAMDWMDGPPTPRIRKNAAAPSRARIPTPMTA